MSLHFAVTDTPTAAEEAAIRAALRDANAAATGLPRDSRPLALPLRDAAGAVVGGLWGRTAWSWLYIENLAVPADQRGRGLGARLLAAAEAEAVARGCVGARLDTYSFQARPFYERHGYALVGEIADCPPGHTRYSLARRLDEPRAAAEPWPPAGTPRASVTLTHAEWEAAEPVIEEGLTTFNARFAGQPGWRPLNLVVRRPGEGRPVGGLLGFTLYRWLFIRELFLPPDLRGGGLGAALLRRAEGVAAAQGCVGSWLDTFSFQARPFYEAQGYEMFGTLDHCPPGHSRHFLHKRIDGANGAT